MREPDLTGLAGKAWRLADSTDPTKSGIVSFLVNRPGAHPFWNYWLVSVIHLRPSDDLPSPNLNYPEAEYEFLIASIDPDRHPEPDPDAPPYGLLSPIDVVEQFHGITDHDAANVGEGAVCAIVLGTLSPDQDYRTHWKQWLTRIVKHYAETVVSPETDE